MSHRPFYPTMHPAIISGIELPRHTVCHSCDVRRLTTADGTCIKCVPADELVIDFVPNLNRQERRHPAIEVSARAK